MVPNTGPEFGDGGTEVTRAPSSSLADRWVVPSIFGQCADRLEDSPHGHIAFLVDGAFPEGLDPIYAVGGPDRGNEPGQRHRSGPTDDPTMLPAALRVG